MIRIVISLFILFAAPALSGEIRLAPGTTLDARHVLELAGLNDADAPDERRIWQFQQPAMPMRNEASVPVIVSLASLDFDAASGRLTGTLEARLTSGEQSRLQVSAISALERRVSVPAVDLAKGSIVGAGDLDWRWLDARQLRDGSLTQPAEMVGLEARRPLRAGRVVQAAMLQPVRHIRRGELVEVTYERDGLALNLVAEALEDGSAGELVRLRNLDSGKRLVARVFGHRQALIDRSVR